MKTKTLFWKKITAVLLAVLLLVTAIPFSASADSMSFAGSDLVRITYDESTSTFRILFSADVISGILRNRDITKQDIEDMLPSDLIDAYRSGGFIGMLLCDSLTDVITWPQVKALVPDYIVEQMLSSDAILDMVDVEAVIANGYVDMAGVVAACKEAFGNNVHFDGADVSALLNGSGVDLSAYISDGDLLTAIAGNTLDADDLAALEALANKVDFVKAVGDTGNYEDMIPFLDIPAFLRDVSISELLGHTDVKNVIRMVDKDALKAWAEATALFTYLSTETFRLNGIDILNSYQISCNALATVAKSLIPTASTLADIPANGVITSLVADVQLVDDMCQNVGSICVGVQVGVFGSDASISYLENNAARVAKKVSCAVSAGNELALTATVPARFSDLVTFLLTDSRVSASVKAKLVSAMNGTVGDVIDYLQGLDVDIVLAFADSLDLRYAEGLVDTVTGLTETYRDRVDRAFGYLQSVLENVPADLTEMSFAACYEGNGRFLFDRAAALSSADIVAALQGRSSFLDQVLQFVADEDVAAAVNIDLTMDNLYQIKFYRDSVLTFTAYLPAGAALTVLSDVKTDLAGTWYDSEGTVVTAMPAEDICVYDSVPETFYLYFKIDGQLCQTVEFTVGDASVTEPEIPEKYGYTGHWGTYDLTLAQDQDVELCYEREIYKLYFTNPDDTINGIVFYLFGATDVPEPPFPAITGYDGYWSAYNLNLAEDQVVRLSYKLHEYILTFKDGTKKTEVKFRMGDTSVAEPAFVGKYGYVGAWSAYDLKYLANQTVQATYTPATYTVTFVADGKPVDTVSYVYGATVLSNVPAVPAKAGNAGVWSAYDLTKAENQTVNAVYNAQKYTVTFVADGQVVGTSVYTYGDTVLTGIPAVPGKDGFTGVWGAYDLTKAEDQTVKAVYSDGKQEYELIFVYSDGTRKTVKYTEGASSVQEPALTRKEGYTFTWSPYVLNQSASAFVYENKTANVYTVTFTADGNKVAKSSYSFGNADSLYVPEVPSKAGYDGAWGAYSVNTAKNQTVEAKYTAKTYKLVFQYEDGSEKVVEYKYGAASVKEPALPEKEGYVYEWAGYPLNQFETVTVELIATKKSGDADETYTVYFYDGNKLLATETFTLGGADVRVPALPEKAGYTSSWSDKADTSVARSQVINVRYTANEYKLNFVVDGKAMSTVTYTYGATYVAVPAVPVKEGYTGVWSSYDLTKAEDQTVQAVYTEEDSTVYKVNFVYADGTVKTVSYQKGATSVEEPALSEKTGYTCTWEKYTLNSAPEITVREVQTRNLTWLWIAIPAVIIVAGLFAVLIMRKKK